MRGAQCTVRTATLNGNSTRVSPRTVIGATLCEDAGHPAPQKVRPCGMGRCPQWHMTEWTPCETSRCFNWMTAMQKRDISCRLDDRENVTLLDPSKCDEAMRPLQRQECYNDACKGVWRVGEWSEVSAQVLIVTRLSMMCLREIIEISACDVVAEEDLALTTPSDTQCTASCEEDGIKYRILQCVWFGTKKPAGNACRDIPRPPVMKTCRGSPCQPPQSPGRFSQRNAQAEAITIDTLSIIAEKNETKIICKSRRSYSA